MSIRILMVLRAAVALCLLACTGVFAESARTVQTLVLDDSRSAFEISGPVSTWKETGRHSAIDMVTDPRNESSFQPTLALQRHELSKQDSLWLHLRLMQPLGNQLQWTLNIPLPFVDNITLYQQDATGTWQAQFAGDALPQSTWSHPGPYPEFDLITPAGRVQDVYLEVRNYREVNVPIRLSPATLRDTQRLRETTVIGIILGLLVALGITSVIRFIQHRNPADGWAALYGLLITVEIAQFNGLLGATLWMEHPSWGDWAANGMPVVTVGCTLLFVRHLYSLSAKYRRFDTFLIACGWGSIASVLCFAVMDRTLADSVTAVVMLCTTWIGLGATLVNWHGGSSISRWLAMTFVPQVILMAWYMLDSIGWLPTPWELRYVMSAAVALAVPLMVYSLSVATQNRKELQNRSRHLTTQDALTGLSTREKLLTAYRGALLRVNDHHEHIALALINVVNYEGLRRLLGDTGGEQCLLRSVTKLHRVMRDVDQAGRTETAQFALLLEGMTTRQQLVERMVKLIASGLIPLPGMEPEVTLQFHVGCVLLHENPVSPDKVLDELNTLLHSYAPRTRRPIRFLEPAATQASPLDTDR
jgi:GGDEF domain-containing protein